MLDSIFTLSIETEHCLHFANISFNNTVHLNDICDNLGISAHKYIKT